MKKLITLIKLVFSIILLSVFGSGIVFAASSDMKGHDMTKSDKIGDLIHESAVDGYMLSYYFMDLRDSKDSKAGSHAAMDMEKSKDMGTKEMDKPHHIMLYIMDKNHVSIQKGKVGFLIKDSQGNKQKAMGMFMSKGFGTTVDMKKKGIYSIKAKAVLGDTKLIDKFNYEIK